MGVTADEIPGPQTLSKCPTLQVGSSGNAMKWLQYVLRVSTDGQFGNGTKIAAMTYPRVNGLVADGIVGQNIWRKILGL